MDTTGKSLVEFWKWAGDKGLVNANTAGGVKATVNQVLGVLDDWESLDVKALDTDDVFRRFMNKRGRDFTPGTLATYRRRFTLGVSDFLSYVNAPDSWKPSVQDRAPRREKRPNGNDVPLAALGAEVETVPDQPPQPPPIGPTRTGLVEYPFPLREGRFAYLRLPVDLTAADVKRLNAYLATLVIDVD